MHLLKPFETVLDFKSTWKSLIVDLLFFFVLGFTLGSLGIKKLIGNNLLYLGDLIIKQSDPTKLLDVIFAAPEFRKILLLAGVAAIITYPLYCLFHGWLWRFALRLKEKQAVGFTKRFWLVNALWFPLFCCYVLINFIFSYADTIAQRLNPGSFPLMATISNILFFGIVYFAFLSYGSLAKEGVLKSIKKSFSYGVRKGYPIAIALVIFSSFMLLVAKISAISMWWFLVLTYLSYPLLMLWVRLLVVEHI